MLSPVAVSHAEGAPPRTLLVGTKNAPPFSIKNPDGSWDGLSIELWREIAAQNGWQFELQEMRLTELLDAVSKGKLDVGVAGITVTLEREKVVDFTHPFYSSGLGIAVHKQSSYKLLSGLFYLLAWQFGALFILLATMTIFFGLVIWLAERRHNEEHFGSGWAGLGHGIWWSVVTMTTVGYGDKAPKTVLGRLVAMVWMLVGVIALAIITGSVAAKMTAARLDAPIRTPDDLTHVRTGTVTDTTSETFLREEGITCRSYASEMDALQALRHDYIDAVVYDAPTLRYAIHHHSFSDIEVLPVRFHQQDYALALPPGSPLRESINRSLVGLVAHPRWEAILRSYLGR